MERLKGTQEKQDRLGESHSGGHCEARTWAADTDSKRVLVCWFVSKISLPL